MADADAMKGWSARELLAALSILKPDDPAYKAATEEAARRAQENTA